MKVDCKPWMLKWLIGYSVKLTFSIKLHIYCFVLKSWSMHWRWKICKFWSWFGKIWIYRSYIIAFLKHIWFLCEEMEEKFYKDSGKIPVLKNSRTKRDLVLIDVPRFKHFKLKKFEMTNISLESFKGFRFSFNFKWKL